MTGDDSILPFQLDRAQMRGRVVRLDATLDQILEQHRYPPAVSALVAEAALITALIGSTMKLKWRFSIQIRGEGAVRLIATDYFAPEAEGEPARIRAYASFDAGEVVSSRRTPFRLLGRGVFGVTIDQGPGTTPYQGITPLTGNKLGDCAEAYFAQSEQIATRFNTLSAHAQEPGKTMQWRAGGLMIQQLGRPGESVLSDGPSGSDGLMNADDVAAMGANEEDWNRVNFLMETVDAHELIGPHLAMEGLLTRLFHEETPRVFGAQAVTFGCTCSAERVEAAMAQYSAKDIAHMTNDSGHVTADCQFCSAHYEFAPDTLGFEAGGAF
ncbi:MAG: Hsp33 family molecular chaperone HslO [Pseudomonadota bacterium]